jgi:hypothetical protein
MDATYVSVEVVQNNAVFVGNFFVEEQNNTVLWGIFFF